MRTIIQEFLGVIQYLEIGEARNAKEERKEHYPKNKSNFLMQLDLCGTHWSRNGKRIIKNLSIIARRMAMQEFCSITQQLGSGS